MRVQNRAACLLLACALTIPTTPVPLAFAEEGGGGPVTVEHLSDSCGSSQRIENCETIEEAFSKVHEGDTVTLLGNYTVTTKDIPEGTSSFNYWEHWRPLFDITFDFNGFFISGSAEGSNSDYNAPSLYFTAGSTVRNIDMRAINSEADIEARLGEKPHRWTCENQACINVEGGGVDSKGSVSLEGAAVSGSISPQIENGQLVGTRVLGAKATTIDVYGSADYRVAIDDDEEAGGRTDAVFLEAYGSNVTIKAGTYMNAMCLASDTTDSVTGNAVDGLRIEGGTFTGGPALPYSSGTRIFNALNNYYGGSSDASNNVHIYGGVFESKVVTRYPNTTIIHGGCFRFDPIAAGATLAEGADYTVEASGSEQGNGQGGANAGSGSEGGQGSSGNGSGVTGGAGSGSSLSASAIGDYSQSELNALHQEIALLQGQGEAYLDIIAALQDRDATLSAKGITKTVKLKKGARKTARSKSATLKVTPSESGATATFSKVSGKRFTVSEDGKVTLRKGAKRGTYIAKVKVLVGESSAVVYVRYNVR